jgi:hypothetical protein
VSVVGMANGCEVVKKHKDFVRNLVKISSDTGRELSFSICLKDGEEEGYTSVGEELFVEVRPCPKDMRFIGSVHTHGNIDFFSSVDYYVFANGTEDFMCVAYEEGGKQYVRCIHRPPNIDRWLWRVAEVGSKEAEVRELFNDYQEAVNNFMSTVDGEEEKVLGKMRELKKKLREKMDELRKASRDAEYDVCILEL